MKKREPQNVQITKGLLQASREAYKAHVKRLPNKRELVKKRSIQDAEKQKLRGAKKVREREVEKLERSSLKLDYKTRRTMSCKRLKHSMKIEANK